MSGKLKCHRLTCDTELRTFIKTYKEYLQGDEDKVLFSK